MTDLGDKLRKSLDVRPALGFTSMGILHAKSVAMSDRHGKELCKIMKNFVYARTRRPVRG